MKNSIKIFDIGSDSTTLRRLTKFSSLFSYELFIVEPQKKFELSTKRLFQEKSKIKQTYLNCAISSSRTKKIFYETADPSASSFYEPNIKLINTYRIDNFFKIVGKKKISCITLKQSFSDAKIKNIDLLNIHAQGSELDCLKVDNKTLKKVTLVRCYVDFVEKYKNQPLADEIISHLKKRGFTLISETEPIYIKDKKISSALIFINDNLKDKNKIYKTIVIFFSLGLHLTICLYLQNKFHMKKNVIDIFSKTDKIFAFIFGYYKYLRPFRIFLNRLNKKIANTFWFVEKFNLNKK